MKKESLKLVAGKVASWSVVVLVLVGSVAISGIADVSGKNGVLSRIFIFFLSAILIIQVVPALMLLGAMLKGVASMVSKRVKYSLENRK